MQGKVAKSRTIVDVYYIYIFCFHLDYAYKL